MSDAPEIFSQTLADAAKCALRQRRPGLSVHIELGIHGMRVQADAAPTVYQRTRNYVRHVSYRDVELSEGLALIEAIKVVVRGLRAEFIENDN